MTELQAITDRIEIEALRGDFTDAVMMNDHDRFAALFVPEGRIRMPDAGLEFVGRDRLRTLGEQREARFDLFVQTTHPGVVEITGDNATGRVISRRKFTPELLGLPRLLPAHT
jgi:SnoaL-like domain